VKFTLPTVSPLQQLTAGCSDDIDEQHADTFCAFFTVFKLIMGFAGTSQQFVFAVDGAGLVLPQQEPAEAFADASESVQLVTQLLDIAFLCSTI
jgi:hypothetical protein